ncbi:aminodeoxychorismate synthase component I [Flavobacterium cyanobacteriorum]|uniref:Aminodeoxychorismate synthase component I n=1 Tax=Flavobacterium cyanobacteriorum TaxID=2022802 RepID=A0A255YS90_9FLAO|nr:anthranilate synthase component I family protein [Flavobacterium cyanobacteriorum]OYQ32076.1 aminodeoxychorismate synthase component I [Flavobacterium cyanobacteriorum]
MRTTATFAVQKPEHFKQQLLQWAQQFREVVFLDSNDYKQQYSSYDAVLAVDAFTSVKTDYENAFDELDTYRQITGDWLFGYLSYDLKNDVEGLASDNFDGLQFPDLFFFQPKKLFLLKGRQLEVHYLKLCDDEIEADFEQITKAGLQVPDSQPLTNIRQRISKQQYLEKVGQMLAHIHRGDIYEANFCMEFYAEDASIAPVSVYQKLNKISGPPFAVFLKHHKQYLLSASPERYLRKEGNKVISQPIKGTSKRTSDMAEDDAIKQQLAINEKERSENIMIVDLVRNDLSRTAARGTVAVEELCGAYTFKQVHHLISTVVSQVAEGVTPVEVIRHSFPMGSMTGAPKISAMQIIEKLEETRRGLYSGAVGYFTPEGDFDFNVVIRSILYNEERQYVSFSVGSAITAKADPAQEYEECLLKAGAMRRVLERE